MAVSRCPSCGDLFFEAVATCPSCGADLVEVEDRRTAPADDRPAASAAHERRELHEWTMEGRRLLDGMLHRAGIPRSWQGSTLLTPEVEHERVEEMVSLVGTGDARVGEPHDGLDADGGVGADGGVDPDEEEVDGTGRDGPDEEEVERDEDEVERDEDDDEPDGDVGYDLTGWTDLARGDLVAALAEAEIEHGWDDEGDLVISAADEARVDAIFERLTDVDGGAAANDELPEDNFYDDVDDDGLLVQETLSDLFVGADRLLHNPLDGSAARLVIDGRDQARALRLPFGFERAQWRTILAATDALADSFEPGGIDDDAIREHAAALRALLRDLV